MQGDSQMINIEIVCKLNQVRSPFLASFLQTHFPKISFTTSGIKVLESEIQNLEASQIAKQWGFPYFPSSSRKFVFSHESFYLPVDDEIEHFIKSKFPQANIANQNVIDYNYFIRKPQDPLGLASNDLAYELAILVLHSTYIFRSEFSISPPHDIYIYRINDFQSAEREVINILTANNTLNNFIVNMCWKDQLIDSYIRDVLLPSDLWEDTSHSGVFSSKFEVVDPEKLYCSLNYRLWLFKLARRKPVIIIIPPLLDHKGGLSVDSILGTIWATDTFQGIR